VWASFLSVTFFSFFYIDFFLDLAYPYPCYFGCSFIVFRWRVCDYLSVFTVFFSETDLIFYFMGLNGGNLMLLQVNGERWADTLDYISGRRSSLVSMGWVGY
jgi:hypothetical protein